MRFAIILVWLVFISCLTAQAQLKSNPAAVNLAANLNTSVTVTASPGLVNFALVRNGTVTGNPIITVNTSWTLTTLIGSVTTYAYFANAAAALTDGSGDNIPSSSVAGSVNGGAFKTFNAASPFGGTSSITLSSTTIFLFNRTGNHQDTLNLQISTVGLALPAGNYTGVLNIRAQAL